MSAPPTTSSSTAATSPSAASQCVLPPAASPSTSPSTSPAPAPAPAPAEDALPQHVMPSAAITRSGRIVRPPDRYTALHLPRTSHQKRYQKAIQKQLPNVLKWQCSMCLFLFCCVLLRPRLSCCTRHFLSSFSCCSSFLLVSEVSARCAWAPVLFLFIFGALLALKKRFFNVGRVIFSILSCLCYLCQRHTFACLCHCL